MPLTQILTFFSIIVVFNQVDNEFLQVARHEISTDGSTCLMGLVCNGRLTVANIGDSIATLVKKDGSWSQMNTEHSPNCPQERARIEASNGSVIKDRVNGRLAVARAFGDFEMKDLVISDPQCRSMPITKEDDFLVLASDGIFRTYSQDHIVRRVIELRKRHMDLGNIAETIVEECIKCVDSETPCYDNVTLIIVSLGDYLMDYEKRSLVNTPEQLRLCRQSSQGHHIDSSGIRMECLSKLVLSESGFLSEADQLSTNSLNAVVNPFFTGSVPSSQTSSP